LEQIPGMGFAFCIWKVEAPSLQTREYISRGCHTRGNCKFFAQVLLSHVKEMGNKALVTAHLLRITVSSYAPGDPILPKGAHPMKNKNIIFAILLLLCWLPSALFAGQHGHSGHKAPSKDQKAPVTAEQVHQGKGTVEGVDPANSTVRLKHAPIESLGWPEMVMDLKVRDPELLKNLKEGDRIAFDLVQTEKEFLITRIEPKR
jgi:Cu/Ag efflux protein CusF